MSIKNTAKEYAQKYKGQRVLLGSDIGLSAIALAYEAGFEVAIQYGKIEVDRAAVEASKMEHVQFVEAIKKMCSKRRVK